MYFYALHLLNRSINPTTLSNYYNKVLILWFIVLLKRTPQINISQNNYTTKHIVQNSKEIKTIIQETFKFHRLKCY